MQAGRLAAGRHAAEATRIGARPTVSLRRVGASSLWLSVWFCVERRCDAHAKSFAERGISIGPVSTTQAQARIPGVEVTGIEHKLILSPAIESGSRLDQRAHVQGGRGEGRDQLADAHAVEAEVG